MGDILLLGILWGFPKPQQNTLLVWPAVNSPNVDKGITTFLVTITVQKRKFSMKNFFSKCDQNCSFLRIW